MVHKFSKKAHFKSKIKNRRSFGSSSGSSSMSDLKNQPQYADSLAVKYSTLVMSISQISETLFILAIPFFLKRFGIKQVMLISIFVLSLFILVRTPYC